ncbi:MAG: hypothetical protein L6R38_006998 [Xanthoria sp. 2 TBL-2021]|nr:MAG: hypothetical protein L6R38_006998 [Xanthoria sp. 2 TBL-2021]
MAEQCLHGAASDAWDDGSSPADSAEPEVWTGSGVDWEQGISEQQESKQIWRNGQFSASILARLNDRTASLKGSLRRRSAWLRRHLMSSETLERSDDEEEEEDGEWAEMKPTVFPRVSRLTAKWKDTFKQKVHRLRGYEFGDEVEDGDNDSLGWHDSETQVHGYDDWPYGSSSQDIEERPKLPSFITPLPDVSDSEDFLTMFLAERRLVDIHPERKHNLALFFARICEEAAFDHVRLHAPDRLVLLRVDAPDYLEWEQWIDLLERLRNAKEIPYRGRGWYSTRTRFEHYVQDCDNIVRLRHVAVHHWDYDSNLIGHVVGFLERLGDEARRKKVEEALRELYGYECAAAAKAAKLEDSATHAGDQVDVPAQPVESVSQASSLTLVSESSSKGSRASNSDSRYLDCNTVDIASSDNGDVTSITTAANTTTATSTTTELDPMTGIFISDVYRPPLTDKSPSVTTHHQFLKSYQTILERSLHEALWRGEDPVLRSQTGPDELTEYGFRLSYKLWTKYCAPSMSAVSSESQDYVKDLLYKVRQIRNMAAHHAMIDTEGSCWCYDNALTLTYLLNDEDATRKVELTTWVADINLRAQAAVIEEKALENSVLDWEKLEHDARLWWKSFGEDKDEYDVEGYRNRCYTRPTLLGDRLKMSIDVFREERRKAGLRLWGEEGEESFQSWQEPSNWPVVRKTPKFESVCPSVRSEVVW